MAIVTEKMAEGADGKCDQDVGSFHNGPLRRCPECGRKVFLPCLACATEHGGNVNDPLDTTEEEPIYIELDGDFRQRYEYCRLEKIAENIRLEDDKSR